MRLRTAVGILISLVTALTWAESPTEYLDRVLRAERLSPGVFIQQHRAFGGQKTQKVMVMRDGEGKSLITILEPLNLQGVQTFDSGRAMHTFFPDDKFVQIRNWGSEQARISPDLRLRLIQRNYKVQKSNGPKVAGLLTTKIVATPHSKDVPRRTIYFARGGTTLLKIELSLGKQNTTVFEILSRSPFEGTVSAPSSTGWNRETTWGPKPLGNEKQTRVLTRITPIIPKSIPHGFEVVDSFYNGRDENNVFLITRLTDGFVLVNVMQGSPKVVPIMAGAEAIRSRTVSLVADGLAPPALLQSLLAPFAPPQSQSMGWEPTDFHRS